MPAHLPWNPSEIAFFVSVRGNDADEIAKYWAPLYGMLRDKFGVTWVLDVEAVYAAA